MSAHDEALAAAASEYAALELNLTQSRVDYAALKVEYERYKLDNPPAPPPAVTQEVLMDINFDKYPAGPFTQAMAKETFGKGVSWTPPNDAWWKSHNTSVVKDGTKGVLNVRLPANTIGGSTAPVFYVPLIREVEDATFGMEFRFVSGFIYDLGGKLPGLAGTNNASSPPSGGSEPTNGYTCRHMWHTVSNRPPGVASCYIYHWRPVATPKWPINRFCFSVFRGGNTDAWMVPVDTHIQFRKFKITTPI
jgi:hypothetical protein